MEMSSALVGPNIFPLHLPNFISNVIIFVQMLVDSPPGIVRPESHEIWVWNCPIGVKFENRLSGTASREISLRCDKFNV